MTFCHRYEARWQAGENPRIEDYVIGISDELRPQLLREIITLDVGYRRRKGEQSDLNDYLGRFPNDHVAVESGFSAAADSQTTADYVPGQATPQVPQPLKVRCPHCHNPVDLTDDRPIAEIVCPTCGSSFGVIGDEALAYQSYGGTSRRRDQFGHFKLLEQIGVGAFGTVWKAHDTQLDRVVARKILARRAE